MDTSEKPSPMKQVMTWIGYFSALVGFFATLAGGYHWLQNRREQSAELKSQMEVADAQAKMREYRSAIKSYDVVLKTHSFYAPALDGQLDTAMDWSENFSSLGNNSQSSNNEIEAQLDEMIAVLDAGFARSKGTRAADVQAHLGWAHWLNSLLQREYSSTAKSDFREALKLDPTNVYAHVMLGFTMLQDHENSTEALSHLNAAVATSKARPLVRHLEILGLRRNDTPGARAALFRVADEMRTGNETMTKDAKQDVLLECCEPPFTDHASVVEALSALPSDETWKTYLWLDDDPAKDAHDALGKQGRQDFIKAALLEISGKQQEAYQQYLVVQKELKGTTFSLLDSANQAVARLSKK